MSDKKLFEQIIRLSGESKKAQIGALFREFQDIRTPAIIDILKTVYANNLYSEEKYPGRDFSKQQLIKDNCTYIRRCSVLALIDCKNSFEDEHLKNKINYFLFSCLNDTEHEVREAILNIAPKEFSETQLIESYNKIRTVSESEKIQVRKDEYTAIRRGIIRALGEKLSLIGPAEKQTIIKFIHGTLQPPRDTDPYICAASAEILGHYGTKNHIEELKSLMQSNVYPAHLRAEKAIKQIHNREIAKGDTKKLLLYKNLQTLQETIKILQKECEKYKKQIEEL